MSTPVLAIDAGNTNCKAALFDEGRIATSINWPADAAPPPFPEAASRAILAVSSVNREASARIRVWAAAAGRKALFIPDNIGYPIMVSLEDPEGVGPDRVLAAAAALHALRAPCVVICAGTATTVDIATPGGGFLGGAILPGPQLMSRSLTRWTSLLPMVEPDPVASYPGRDTRGAIGAGVAIGALGAVKELVRAARAALPDARLALTGGNAGFFGRRLDRIDLEDECLVLRGIALAAASGGVGGFYTQENAIS